MGEDGVLLNSYGEVTYLSPKPLKKSDINNGFLV